jgi:Glycosyltransferase family 87
LELESQKGNPGQNRRLARFVFGLWAGACMLIGIRVTIYPGIHNVYRVFAKASHNWVAGNDLYPSPIPPDPYRYSPLIAALLTPLSMLPDTVAALVWRFIGTVGYLMALLWWCRRGVPNEMNRRCELWMLLLVFPMSIESISNGQSNELIMALLLAAVTCAALERWYLTAACTALAASFKIYPLCIGLLIAAVYPFEMVPALLIAIFGVVLIPFGLQRPAYVLRQYRSWRPLLQINSATHYPFFIDGRDLRYLLKCWNIAVNSSVYLTIQVGSAIAIAIWCVKAHRAGWQKRLLLLYLLTLGSIWMLLLGPAAEQSTYILLAPSIAFFLIESRSRGGHPLLSAILFFSYGLFLTQAIAGILGRYYFSAITRLGLQPMAAVLMTIYLIGSIATQPRLTSASTET